MNKKHVILVANHSLLGDGLEKLLSENDQLCLYRVAALDYHRLLALLHRQEQVVMVVEREAIGEDVGEFVQLLAEFGNLQIIIISSESNKVQVFSSYQTALPGVNDLTTLIVEAARPAPKFRHRYTPINLSDQLFSLSWMRRQPT